MTLPPSLSELDGDSETDHDLSRVSLLVGPLMLDVGMPTHAPIASYLAEVVELASDQLPVLTDLADVEFDATEDRWTLARLGGEVIDPNHSLAEAGVYDGDVLMVQEVGRAPAPVLFDDVDRNAAEPDARARWVADNRERLGWFGLAVVLATIAAALLAARTAAPWAAAVPIAAIAALAVGVVCAVAACVLGRRAARSAASPWLAAVGLPLIFAGSCFVVPGGNGVTALPMALGLIGLAALLQLLISGRGRALYTGVIAVAVLGVPASIAEVLLAPPSRSVGAMLATVAVIVVYVAPRVTISLSKLPVPRVPTAGEPLDDIETQGGTTVEGVQAIGKQVVPTEEGMTERVRRANDYLSGIIAAAAVVALVGCVLAVDVGAGFFWQGTAFSVAVATALCLRGRSHHDLVQSATLVGAGMLIALALIVKTATYVRGWQVNSALALIVLMVLVVLCGVVAPRTEFSPVMRRRVEILEYLSIALIFPLACWILRLYAFMREMRL